MNQPELPMTKMRVDVTIKDGPKTLIELKGRVDAGYFRVIDIDEVYKLEAAMERLTGYRFHIFLNTSE